MPIYEYACRTCGSHLEAVQSFTDEALTVCPSCGGSLRKVFGNVGISFKGSGFYKTDSRSSGGKAGKKDGEKSDVKVDAKADSSASSSGGSSSDGSSSSTSSDTSDTSSSSTSATPSTSSTPAAKSA